MSDLISRKKIHDYIKGKINPYGKPFEGTAYELGLKIMRYIDAMDSAYSVDKVVEELEKLDTKAIIRYKGGTFGDYEGTDYYIKKSDAIEIVKQEAGQYNNAIIDGKYCFQSCACTEKCDKCSRLCNGDIDWYENIDNWTEPYQLKGEIDE